MLLRYILLFTYFITALASLNDNYRHSSVEASDSRRGEHEIPILTNSGETLLLEENNLRELLLNDEVRDTHVCVISIAGAFRTGKSFLLNLILRYFENEGWKGNKRDWLMKNPEDVIPRDFRWGTGSAGLTKGINAWSKPIITQKNDGSKIAVILLDTQGNFDNKETKAKNARVFGLSTLFSSFQIINVHRQIQSNDLENLQTFVEFSKVFVLIQTTDANDNMREKSKFQDLGFFVRDWVFGNHEPGSEGGKMYLHEVKTGIENESSNGQESVMDYLDNTFQNISCYLMPPPSEKIQRGSDDDNIRVSEMGKDFLENLIEFFDKFLNPEKLTVKSIGLSDKATGKELFEYVKTCAESILLGEGPIMMSEMEGIVEFTNNKYKDETLKWYREHSEKKLKDIELWNDYDEMIVAAKQIAKNILLSKLQYGNKNPNKMMESLLSEPFKEIDLTTLLLMRDHRDKFVSEQFSRWLEKSTAELRKTNARTTPPSIWTKKLVQLDERDSQNLRVLRENYISNFLKSYNDARNDDSSSLKKLLIFTLFTAGITPVAGPFAPLAGALAVAVEDEISS